MELGKRGDGETERRRSGDTGNLVIWEIGNWGNG